MDTKKEARKYMNKYFKQHYLDDNTHEFKSLVRLLNKARKPVKKCDLGDVGDSALTSCQSNRDGDCEHPKCPQILDNEPEASGRSCPIYDWNHEDEV